MKIDFLYWALCPSHPQALDDLRQAMTELELDPSQLTVREIATQEEADLEDFPGSPTIRVDGIDIEPADGPAQLTCRIYRRADGRISPTPDPARVRAALAAAKNPDDRRNR